METQAEMTDERRAEIEKIAANLEAKLDPKEADKAKKSKKKAKEPSKEDIQAAVAGVVLAEMKFWPEQIVSLIGEQHPNKESFLKGVAYVIGGYMHFARKALEELVKLRKKEAELKTCGLLSPVTKELQDLRAAFNKAVEDQIADLEKKRKRAINAINAKYDRLVADVKDTDPPERMVELDEREETIKSAYEGACGTIDKEAKAVSSQIQEIEEAAENWNSKERKARRMANGRKDAAQQEQTAVE